MAEINGQQIDNLALAEAIIDDYKDSKIISDMVTANEYYMVQNTEIKNKKREYTDGRGGKKENENVSNVKLANALYKKAVKQKVDYAFGKPPVIAVEAINPDERNKEEKKLYQTEWDKLLNAKHRKVIKTLAKNAINCGIGYIYPWIDENQDFNIVDVPSETIYPYWKDRSHTQIETLVRNYTEKVFEDGEFEEVGKAELWTPEEVSYFNNDNGSLELLATNSHMTTESWGRVPFIWLKTDDEQPLLNTVKTYVDTYDKLNSESVDTLRDDLDTVVVLKNYSSETGKLIEAYRSLKEIKVVAVDENGGVEFLKNDPNITSIDTKLANLKKEIEEYTSTVNIKEIQLSNNPSGVSIKAAFQDTDTYINDIETEFEMFIDNLKYFYDKYLHWTGKVDEKISSKYKIVATLDRDLMINETEILGNVVKLQGMVSQETLDNNNPYVESHSIEQARREAEAEKNAETDNLFKFDKNEENIDNEGMEEIPVEAE